MPRQRHPAGVQGGQPARCPAHALHQDGRLGDPAEGGAVVVAVDDQTQLRHVGEGLGHGQRRRSTAGGERRGGGCEEAEVLVEELGAAGFDKGLAHHDGGLGAVEAAHPVPHDRPAARGGGQFLCLLDQQPTASALAGGEGAPSTPAMCSRSSRSGTRPDATGGRSALKSSTAASTSAGVRPQSPVSRRRKRRAATCTRDAARHQSERPSGRGRRPAPGRTRAGPAPPRRR